MRLPGTCHVRVQHYLGEDFLFWPADPYGSIRASITAGELISRGYAYWRRVNGVDAWIRWREQAARWRAGADDEDMRSRRVLRAALRVWRESAATPGVDEICSSSNGSNERLTEVHVFGAGAFGQLGHGGQQDMVVPTKLRGLGALRVRAVRVASTHPCAREHRPASLDTIANHKLCTHCQAACGDSHSALISSEGEIFTFGNGEFGMLGHGSKERASKPRRVEALVGEHAVAAACGWRHTMCLTANGRIYSWGHGGFGQLGHGGLIDFFLPLKLQDGSSSVSASPRTTASERGGRRSSISWHLASCGWRHSAAVSEAGHAYTWGDAEHMQLGHGDRRGSPQPRIVEALAGEVVRQLECGTHHCAAVTRGGHVYTWGSGRSAENWMGPEPSQLAAATRCVYSMCVCFCGSFGQLGHGERRNQAIPRLVASLTSIDVVRVACGGHTCVLGAFGDLYTFGNGKHGQLGHGDERVEATPRRVNALRVRTCDRSFRPTSVRSHNLITHP